MTDRRKRYSNSHIPAEDRYLFNNCYTNKRAYQSRSDAKAGALKALSYGQGRMRPYACSHCGAWHIGHLRKDVA